ncbi:hypothetical protein MJH12_09390 [bacterium]|nr:hypothetical protein [bacterium]
MRYLILITLLLISNTYSHNTWFGPTGLIMMPTTTLVRPQETSVSTFFSFGSGDNYQGINASFSFSEKLEVSLADMGGRKDRRGSSSIFSFKYSPYANLAVGAMFDNHNDHKNTIYGVVGSPENSVYLGVGANFGSGKRALLGNYSTSKNDMESFFFMAGARVDLSELYPSLEALLEFNGDTMSVGLGYIPKTNWDFQVDYMSSGDLQKDDKYTLSLGARF